MLMLKGELGTEDPCRIICKAILDVFNYLMIKAIFMKAIFDFLHENLNCLQENQILLQDKKDKKDK